MRLLMLLATVGLAASLAGCVVVPARPYYVPRGPVYVEPAPAVYIDGRWHHDWHDGDRRDWRDGDRRDWHH